MSDVDPRWYESFFDDDWLAIALDHDGERTPAEVDFVVVQRDMRELAFDAEFDAALNLFSSFGYFAVQEEDERVLAGIARALRAGGRLVLDVVNPASLIARLRPQGFEELADGRVLLQETGYDVRTGRSMHTLTIVRPDGSRARRSYSIRMYTAPELEAMLGRTGFRVVELHGGFDGAELTRETWRLILTAERVE